MMKKALFLILAFSILLTAGCTQSIRYTEEEISGFSPVIQENIRKGQVGLGMSQGQVRYAWGSPDSIKLLEPFDGKAREEWIYAQEGTFGVIGTKILLFYDGKLIYVR